MRIKGKDKKIPFWMQILAILLVGIIASLSVSFYFQDKKAEKYTVTFAYDDGTIIEEKQVKKGFGVLPPEINTDKVFRGWNSTINNVTQNIEVHPDLYNITEDNLFYFNSIYVKEGKKFTIDLYVAGNVSVSSGSLFLEYDTDVLTYKKYEGYGLSDLADSNGKINVEFESSSTITKKTKLISITFYAKKMDALSTEIVLKSNKVLTIQNGGEIIADNATINNKIFFLQEVR